MGYPRRYAAIGGAFGALIGIFAAASAWDGLASAAGAFPILVALNWLSVPFGPLLAFPVSAVTGSSSVGFRTYVILVPTLNWGLLGFCVGYWRSVREEVRARKNPRPSV